MKEPAHQAPFLLQLTRLLLWGLADLFHWPKGGKMLPETTPLHEAARRGDIAALRRLICEGADLNAPDRALNTALHVASSPTATLVLLEAGADPNCENAANCTPLDLADGKRARHLLRYGAHGGLKRFPHHNIPS